MERKPDGSIAGAAADVQPVVVLAPGNTSAAMALAIHLGRANYRVFGILRHRTVEAVPLPFEPVICASDEPDDFNRAHRYILELAGRIDVLITCQDEIILGACEELGAYDILESLRRAFVPAVQQVLSVAPLMRLAGAGRIINIVSLPTNNDYACLGVHGAAQTATLAWSRAASREWSKANVKISAVDRGIVRGQETGILSSGKSLRRYDLQRSRAFGANECKVEAVDR